MKVFSTFSGIGGFELGIIKALGEENVEIVGYCEIDKFSSAVLAHRFPGVRNYGDIKQLDIDKIPNHEIFVWGSPCQDLSISCNNWKWLQGARSGLFFEYVRILRMKQPSFFVLENVASMKNKDRDFISELLDVEPIKINSTLLTAQNRNRYYRTNIPNVAQPKDRWVLLSDIIELCVDEKYFVDWQNRTGKKFYLTGFESVPNTFYEARTKQGYQERSRNKKLFGINKETRNKETSKLVAKNTQKANCLTGGIRRANLLIVHKKWGFGQNELAVRMPTPIECERLQGFPDNRTLVPWKDRMMSDTQRYKQTWNAVTVDVIEHIFLALKTYLQETNQALTNNVFTPPKKQYQSKQWFQYVAYYAYSSKKGSGFSLATQQAIVNYFAVQEQTSIIESFHEVDLQERVSLHDAIKYCKQHGYHLIIANLKVLALDETLIFSVKQQLGDTFKSCDLPTTDRLSISIALGILQRDTILQWVKRKATRNTLNQRTWNAQNFTSQWRKKGLETIKRNASNNLKKKQLIEIISKCRAEGMGFGLIAKELNEKGFTSLRWKRFYGASVRRLYTYSIV